MKTDKERFVIEIFGQDNLDFFQSQQFIIDTKVEKLQELCDLRERASSAFNFNLSYCDIAVSAGSGVLLGIGNALFKDWIPQHGPLAHHHGETRTGIDHGIPKPPGFSGSVNDLHRQIGPSHDIFRFKDALGLMQGKVTDFNLWGSTATKILGHELSPGNMKLSDFRDLGGFNIPDDPAGELVNHLLIDFFTKRSLPIPGSTYLADSSPEMAKLMLGMYRNGLNLKVASGNFLGFALVQIIIHGYAFLFKAVPQSEFSLSPLEWSKVKHLFSTYAQLIRANNFHGMMMLAHGSSFLADSAITLGTKSYAGLLQLNYLSLIAFSKHLLQYMLKNITEYKELIAQANERAVDISNVDDSWVTGYRTRLQKQLSNPTLVSALDKDEWCRNTARVSAFEIHVKEYAAKRREQQRLLLS